MSGEADGNTSAASTAPAPAAEQSASDALYARVEEKKQRANIPQPFGADAEKRGTDGKFKAKPKADAKNTDDNEKADKPDDKNVKPDVDVEAIKAEAASHAARVAELEGTLSEWEDVGPRALAEIDTLHAYVARLEAHLESLGGAVDPRDIENLTLQRELSVHKTKEESAKAQAEARAESEKQRIAAEQNAANAAALNSLKTDLRTIVAKHPELKPTPGSEALPFWKQVYDAHLAGGPEASKRVAAQLLPVFVKAIKANAKASQQPARTLSNMGGTGGGAVRDLSPEGIREKYARRLQGR